MAHSKQAQKRILQNDKRRLLNKAANSAMRTAIKKLRALLDAGQKEDARKAMDEFLGFSAPS